MFYDGDLQSGIAKAVQESKLLACFVTDDGGEESKLWENCFLQEEPLKSSLSEQAIVLRLVAGSQEAGFLAAIYPLPKTPTIVIIKDGDLKEYIAAGVTKEEFFRRLAVVCQTSSQSTTFRSNAPSASVTQQTPNSPLSQASRPPATTSPNPAASTQPVSRAVQDMLAERATRLEVDKSEKEAAEKAKRIAEAKARKSAAQEEEGEEETFGTPKSANLKYALMQKKRQQEARAERERILKRVEDDKAERREREAQRKAQTKAKQEAEKQDGEPLASSSSLPPTFANKSTDCALQVRLFDGSTIRSRFPSNGSLRADVRPWIDEHQNGDTPYTFKHILTPLPNKNISISDEEQILHSQGLTPSATLILVPVESYTSAYEDGASGGIVSRVASGGYGLVSSGVGLVTGVLGSFLGGGSIGTGASSSQERRADPAPVNANPAMNVRTLRDRNSDDQQFYNGNALNFEPRKDKDDKKEK